MVTMGLRASRVMKLSTQPDSCSKSTQGTPSQVGKEGPAPGCTTQGTLFCTTWGEELFVRKMNNFCKGSLFCYTWHMINDCLYTKEGTPRMFTKGHMGLHNCLGGSN